MSRIIGSSLQATDHHSGWEYVAAGQTLVITQYKQMVVFGEFLNDGEVQIEGTLVVEE